MERTRRRMILLTGFILANCVFWSAMDVLVYEVPEHWTIYRIYLPVFVMFSVVLWAWVQRSTWGLRVSAALCGLVGMALVGYAVFLLLTQPVWGVVTLLFVPLFAWLGRASLQQAGQ